MKIGGGFSAVIPQIKSAVSTVAGTVAKGAAGVAKDSFASTASLSGDDQAIVDKYKRAIGDNKGYDGLDPSEFKRMTEKANKKIDDLIKSGASGDDLAKGLKKISSADQGDKMFEQMFEQTFADNLKKAQEAALAAMKEMQDEE